jgi:hypothetical protein
MDCEDCESTSERKDNNQGRAWKGKIYNIDYKGKDYSGTYKKNHKLIEGKMKILFKEVKIQRSDFRIGDIRMIDGNMCIVLKIHYTILHQHLRYIDFLNIRTGERYLGRNYNDYDRNEIISVLRIK